MVRVQCVVEDQWMSKVAPDPEMFLVLVTTHAKVALTREVLKKNPSTKKEKVLQENYLDPTHQKEFYQETMEVIRKL